MLNRIPPHRIAYICFTIAIIAIFSKSLIYKRELPLESRHSSSYEIQAEKQVQDR